MNVLQLADMIQQLKFVLCNAFRRVLLNKNMKKTEYKPSKKFLENYADILVNFALGEGKGIKKGDVVYVSKTKFVGDQQLFGVKSPIKNMGLVWFSKKEFEIL